MKKHFYTLSFFYLIFCILGILACFSSCSNKNNTPPKPVFGKDTPGGEVLSTFEDNTPQVVYYYDTDEKENSTKKQIGVAEFYPNQQERLGGGLKDGKREGQWYAYFPDGSLQVDAYYIDGIEHGSYIVYRDNGNPLYKGHYDHGNCDGTWYWYDENGNQIKKIKADKNTIACEYCPKCIKLKQK